MSRAYYRPVPSVDAAADGLPLAGTCVRFASCELIERGRAPMLVPLSEVPPDVLDRLSTPRAAIAGIDLSAPRLMGIVNVTPDSFSDGGQYLSASHGTAHGLQMAAAGADILDVGGESTRPGATFVGEADEIARVRPVVAGLRGGTALPISIDTRKAGVARAAMAAGASIVNDVSGFDFDRDMAGVARDADGVCLMHAQGTPDVMQDDPAYDDVLLDVYDALEVRRDRAVAAGTPAARILLDPGIGFGKTGAHNIALLRRISLFHGLGCAILLGVSRKRFIGTIGNAPEARARAPGSIAVALSALAQGVQVLRVHDIAETRQAVSLWQALHGAT